MIDWAKLWEEEMRIHAECSPTIKELKLKGFTYGKITTELQKTYPNITQSTVSKLGRKLLGSMHDYRKNPDGTITKKKYTINVNDKVMGLLEEARKRLRVDLGRTNLPSYSETIEDFINKC